MKQLTVLLALVLIGHLSFGQIVKPLHWTWKAEHVKGDDYKLIFTAMIDRPWHTYSTYLVVGKDGGPVKTSFTFEKNPDIELIGKMIETGSKVKEGMDDVFGINLKTYEEKVVFEQHIKLKKNTKVKGAVEYMACDDKSCLPPDSKNFEIAIP